VDFQLREDVGLAEWTGAPRAHFVAALQEVAHRGAYVGVDGTVGLAFAAVLEVVLPALQRAVDPIAQFRPCRTAEPTARIIKPYGLDLPP